MTAAAKNLAHTILLVILLFSLPGCSDKIPTLPKLGIDDSILTFGNSLTYGTGANKDESYPAILETLLHRTVVNGGKPGELSTDGVRRLPALLEQYKPKLLILCHGGNDFLRKQSQSQLIDNIKEMIQLAQQRGINVVLIGVPEPKLVFMKTAPLYLDIAKQFNIPIENNILASVEKNSQLKSDPIHPNAQGYRQIAEAIFQLLVKSGTI